jgi:hypothetical protein
VHLRRNNNDFCDDGSGDIDYDEYTMDNRHHYHHNRRYHRNGSLPLQRCQQHDLIFGN